jgi:hypothetical protein
MLAVYDGYVYMANVQNDQVTLMTYDHKKSKEGFETKRDYFKRTVKLNDPFLEAVYELHYWVRYNDNVEDNDIWLIDEGRSVGLKTDIENGEVIIDVAHDAKDESWIQYEKGAAAKKINLSKCTEYFVEKNYIKRNDRIVHGAVERTSVTLSVLKNSMIMNRRVNL